MKLEQIITEVIVPIGDNKTVFSTCRARIRIADQGGGPYLMIEGRNEEPDIADGETGHEFYLQTLDEIDQFADICRNVLMKAQMTTAV